ncbi:hypothetical protein AgCh_014147 [Apium graveolens]
MILTSWNCRGVGNPRSVRCFRDLVKSRPPDFLFLSETLADVGKISDLCGLLGFDKRFSVDRVGQRGGLAVMWKRMVRCKVIGSGINYIDLGFDEGNGFIWRLTCFYGMPERSRRQESWNLLRHLSTISHLPWCVYGNFNDLLYTTDNKEKHPHPQVLMDGFRAALEDCQLSEIDLEGGQFTWEKSRGSPAWVRERLDRAFASQDWWHKFPLCRLSVSHTITSDHDPISLELCHVAFSRKKFIFKFKNAWLREPKFNEEVVSYWKNIPASHFLPKLLSISSFMAQWGHKFFHKFRDKVKAQKIIVDDLVNKVDDEECSFPAELNDTNLVLIPKKEMVEKMTDLRPIALCNVLYKILAKVVANRLKRILLTLIEKGGLEGGVALKLDINKAYDRVDWNYLQFRLYQMGFHTKFVRWMMLFVTTVQYSVCFNGQSVGPINPKRGLRQGDPISPYLFLLCVEGLSKLITETANNNKIQGWKVCSSAPALTHLLFADDSLLFFRASCEEAFKIKAVLNEYEARSGHAVNFQNSGVYFSANVSPTKQEELKAVLGVYNNLEEGKCLGLPSLIGRSKKIVFNFLKERVNKKIADWSNKTLSKAGKTILIKGVAQSIPTYCMSCFKIPKSLCNDIERLMNGYWWNSGEAQTKGIWWLSWERMGVAKCQGGMGFRNLVGFNLALLGKHIWNFLENPHSLVARVFKARYYPNNHLLQAIRGGGSSYIWSGLWEAKEMLKTGYRWILGDGESIYAHKDPWLRSKKDFYVEGYQQNSTRDEKVSFYFRHNIKEWDDEKVQMAFSNIDAGAVLETRVPQNPRADRLAWTLSIDGKYSVKTGYNFWLSNTEIPTQPAQISGWKRLWRLALPHKVKIFLWRFCRNTIPVRLEVEPQEKITIIATVLGAIWSARNNKVWEGKVVTPKFTVDRSFHQIMEWKEAVNLNKNRGQVMNRGSNAQIKAIWQRP